MVCKVTIAGSLLGLYNQEIHKGELTLNLAEIGNCFDFIEASPVYHSLVLKL